MSEPIDGDAPAERGPVASAPRDGLIDFSQYSLAQLRELQHSIDPTTFPSNFRNLHAALERLERQDDAAVDQDRMSAVRFTDRSGWLGWIASKLKRLPVYGSGSVLIRDTEIVLQGWQRTWLGVPVQAAVSVPTERVRNVASDGDLVRFEVTRRFLRRGVMAFCAGSAAAAERIATAMPATRSEGFQKRWEEVRQFNEAMRSVGARAWVTPVLLVANIVVFFAMAYRAGRLGLFDGAQLLISGSNYGPLTITGQWWRLVTALFLHISALHLVLNMWALWNVGRLTERLYGRWVFLFLYFAAGVLGGLSSIVWDPRQNSVGASGAIFGVMGALLAFLAHRESRVPKVIIRAHWLSTLAFVLFNLVSGALQPGVDNAAHVGGLIGGFVLGWVLLRPLDADARAAFPLRQSAAAAMLAGVGILFALLQTHAIRTQLTGPELYWRAHSWYLTGEAANLQRWQELGRQASSGTVSDASLGDAFEKDVLPFWVNAQKTLRAEAPPSDPKTQAYSTLHRKYVDTRLDMVNALLDATKNGHTERLRDVEALGKTLDATMARMERLTLRESMDHRPRALANSAFVRAVRRLIGGRFKPCVERPAGYTLPVAPSDDAEDGPALRRAEACRAQRLFLDADYRTLDSMMTQHAAHLNDLPDGESSLHALSGGLFDLFEYGNLDLDQAFGQTADWRRAFPNSVNPDLVEASLFEAWAWAARGHDYAKSVSPQAWALFAHRNEMAAAALEDLRVRAWTNPLWQEANFGLTRIRDSSQEVVGDVFERAVAVVPDDTALYDTRVISLMPRWGGSPEQLDAFITAMNQRSADPERYVRYTQLYTTDAYAEGDDVDFFAVSKVDWESMKIGFRTLIEDHEKSDYMLNMYAYFACRAGDLSVYKALRPKLQYHDSASAWTPHFTMASCDHLMGIAPGSWIRTGGLLKDGL